MPIPKPRGGESQDMTWLSQAYYWKNLWQQGEQESLADIAAGRVYVFDDIDEALRFLEEDE
jgi:hypothetical protein